MKKFKMFAIYFNYDAIYLKIMKIKMKNSDI